MTLPDAGAALPAPEVARPWVAEVEVSASGAARLIESQFPFLAPVRLTPLAAGWDNTVFVVNGGLVFRFPRRAIAVPLLETEGRVLPSVAPRLPLAVPAPIYMGHSDETFRWPFLGYRLIPGRTVSDAALDDHARAGLARPLAAFLRALHVVPVDDARHWGAPPDTLGRLDPDRVRRLLPPRIARLVELGVIASARPWLAVVDDGLSALVQSPPPVLLHGDFYSRHVLVDDRGHATGVIDFGDMHIGHPGLDLSIAYSLLPPDARETFFGHYGAASDAVRAVARMRALSSAIFQEAYGRDVGDRATEAEGRRALHAIVSE